MAWRTCKPRLPNHSGMAQETTICWLIYPLSGRSMPRICIPWDILIYFSDLQIKASKNRPSNHGLFQDGWKRPMKIHPVAASISHITSAVLTLKNVAQLQVINLWHVVWRIFWVNNVFCWHPKLQWVLHIILPVANQFPEIQQRSSLNRSTNWKTWSIGIGAQYVAIHNNLLTSGQALRNIANSQSAWQLQESARAEGKGSWSMKKCPSSGLAHHSWSLTGVRRKIACFEMPPATQLPLEF